jgi:galactonate dehydratase
VRDRVRVYQSIGGDQPQAAAESALLLIEKYGYTAIKMAPHNSGSVDVPSNQLVRTAAARVRAVREAVGPDVDIGVDNHARFYEVSRAIRMAKAVEPYDPFWLEEPIRPENPDAMRKLSEHVEVPLAGGESNYTKFEFRDLIALQALDIIQPDICVCGGIMEMKKIAAMAEAQFMAVAPHNPMSPLATAVSVHFAASTSNFLVLEYHAPDAGARKDVLKAPLMVKQGYVEIPNRPGWGVELNEEAFKHYPPRAWKRPTHYRPDGSISFQ